MTRRTSPELEAKAAAMLAAGWPMTAVAEETGLTYRTIRRIKDRSGVTLGEDKESLIEAAKESLCDALGSDFARIESARLVRTQATICNTIQERTCDLLDRIKTDDPDLDPLKAAKLLSACATASKLSADSLRQVLTLTSGTERAEDLPELVVRQYTDEEEAEIRAAREDWSDQPED